MAENSGTVWDIPAWRRGTEMNNIFDEMLALIPMGYVCKLYPPSRISGVWDCVIKRETIGEKNDGGACATGMNPSAALRSALLSMGLIK